MLRRLNQTAALTVFAIMASAIPVGVHAVINYGAGGRHSGLFLVAALLWTALSTMALAWVFQAFAKVKK